MPLTSELFKGDPKLEACLVSNGAHVAPGARGAHVGKIQRALITLGEGVIGRGEIQNESYGATTAAVVLAFKTRRQIINRSYQQTPDNIVGIMTMDALDKAMADIKKKLSSQLVSLTESGPDHNHALCPRLEAGGHKGTPINPQGFGRKINIYGDHETDYLRFEDYAVNSDFARGRKLTWTGPGQLADSSASDICFRSSPMFDATDKKGPQAQNESDEVKRIAMPGCRLTWGGTQENINLFQRKFLRLGVIMEKVVIDEELGPAGNFTVFVLTILK